VARSGMGRSSHLPNASSRVKRHSYHPSPSNNIGKTERSTPYKKITRGESTVVSSVVWAALRMNCSSRAYPPDSVLLRDACYRPQSANLTINEASRIQKRNPIPSEDYTVQLLEC
jgi:hypothetical protein